MTDAAMIAEDSFTAEMRGEVLWVEWVIHVTVTDHGALSLVERANALSPNTCPPMLVMLNEMVSLSRGALTTFSHGLNIAAMALVGPSPVDQLLVSYFTEVHEPPYPTRHFTTVDGAYTWLTEHPHA
ncbi:DUF7793 family protein [Arthrobacter sp. RIT-PI-e]|uniref:DUF7793 family protein n=1 Tax=Arthrobacter sp. RIT-PI-e TaxID=1681197 RepID=UPI000B1A6E39|nr:hypothetical protein [Arthrobacter sp. RIT-PI-e]